jgi:plasmid stabilization system protein ParE
MGHAGLQTLVQAVKIEWSAGAVADLDRFADFLQSRFPTMARIVGREIVQKVDLLVQRPELGRPLSGHRDRRQIVVRVLNASYIVEYRLLADRLMILRVFHGRESRDS